MFHSVVISDIGMDRYTQMGVERECWLRLHPAEPWMKCWEGMSFKASSWPTLAFGSREGMPVKASS